MLHPCDCQAVSHLLSRAVSHLRSTPLCCAITLLLLSFQIDNAECIGAISLMDRIFPFVNMEKSGASGGWGPPDDAVRSVGLARVELERLTRFWRNFDVGQA